MAAEDHFCCWGLEGYRLQRELSVLPLEKGPGVLWLPSETRIRQLPACMVKGTKVQREYFRGLEWGSAL